MNYQLIKLRKIVKGMIFVGHSAIEKAVVHDLLICNFTKPKHVRHIYNQKLKSIRRFLQPSVQWLKYLL